MPAFSKIYFGGPNVADFSLLSYYIALIFHSSHSHHAITPPSTALPPEIPQYRPQEQIVRRRQPLAYKMWQEESESAPSFTFLLRPRVIQCHQTCKLLCCLSGKPVPTVKWFKGNQELSKFDYSMSHSDGVVAMEIVNCRPEDSGKYKCVATNHHGTDETSCVVIVEGKCVPRQPLPSAK